MSEIYGNFNGFKFILIRSVPERLHQGGDIKGPLIQHQIKASLDPKFLTASSTS
jgi:hypothetical protein